MSKDTAFSRDIFLDLQPSERERLAWLIIQSRTDSSIFSPELVTLEVDRYRANPAAYVYDDPLFLLPYMEHIFGTLPFEQRRN